MNPTTHLPITYACGSFTRTAPGDAVRFNDLLNTREDSIGARVGLGRLLTLPYLLGEPIALRIPNPRDLADPADRDLVAILLAGTHSTLQVGDQDTNHASRWPDGELLAPIGAASSSLSTEEDIDVWDGRSLAVPNLTHALLRGLELSGPEAAAVLNGTPRWRARSKGRLGHTRHTVADAVKRAQPVDLSRIRRRRSDFGPIGVEDLLPWNSLLGVIATFGQLNRVRLTMSSATALTEQQLVILETVVDYTDGTLTRPGATRSLEADGHLSACARFMLDVIFGAFLAPTRTHPPRDAEAASAFAAEIRRNRPDMPDRSLARRLNEHGFLTTSRVGAWHAGRAKTLLANTSADTHPEA